MELFAKTINSFYPLTISQKSTFIDARLGYKCSSDFTYKSFISLKCFTSFISSNMLLKENVRNFQKTVTYFLCENIWLENFLFCHETCFLRKTWILFVIVIVIDKRYLITLFWKIAHYFSRLSRELKLTSL